MKASHSLLVVALAHCCVPAAAFAGPRDDLLRLVPDDYTFCVVVQNLRGQGKSGGDASWLKGFAESPLIKQMQTSPEAKKVQAAIEEIFKGLDVSPEQFRDDILGDAVIFAYRKGPPGQQDKDDGLILVHARDDKLLARLVDRINELQVKGGEVKAVEPVGKDGRYFRRVKAVETEKADYYALRGHKLLFSGSEALLKAMLARLDRAETDEPALAKRMKALGVNDSPVAMLINPRAFDADVAESAKTGKRSEQAFLKEFGRYWKAVDGLAVSMNFSPAIEIALSINVRKEELPEAAVRHFAEAGKMSPLWSRIPDDALFAFVGRVHLESLAAMFGAFLTQPDRDKVLEAISEATRPFLEMDDFGPIARGLGPDVGIWVTRPDAADKTWVPQGIVAVKTADNQDGRLAEQAAVRGLDFLARLACTSNKELRVRREKQGDVEVLYLTHQSAFPPGFRPCFASKGGYILVASSPETIGRFEPPTATASDPEEVPVLRISVSGWRKYLKDHRKDLVEYIAAAKKVEPSVLNSTIDSLMPLTEGLDRIEIVQRSAPGRVTVALRFKEARK
jgi:hypothetical protein